jgi:hypothetical protein
MTLPTPGVSLSLSQIQAEFGGANPISLTEYYAGGAYVPAGTTGSNGAVPSGGTISISKFYGTSNIPPLSVTADSVSGFDSGPSSSGFVTTSGSTNTTPAGGVAPYTYAWTNISTSSGNTPTVSSSTAQNPSWTGSQTDPIEGVSTWRVTVTDSASTTAQDDITVTLVWVDSR